MPTVLKAVGIEGNAEEVVNLAYDYAATIKISFTRRKISSDFFELAKEFKKHP